MCQTAWWSLCLHTENNKVSKNLFDTRFEVLWLTIRPSRLPRGIPNIILGIVYHPPGADCLSMIQYLYECLTIMESEFPNNGTILLGDFNKLKVSRIQNAFKLKQVVKFPTRGRNILDLILTDLDKFYDSPRENFRRSDCLIATMYLYHLWLVRKFQIRPIVQNLEI